jgi:hypothetical protein
MRIVLPLPDERDHAIALLEEFRRLVRRRVRSSANCASLCASPMTKSPLPVRVACARIACGN